MPDYLTKISAKTRTRKPITKKTNLFRVEYLFSCLEDNTKHAIKANAGM